MKRKRTQLIILCTVFTATVLSVLSEKKRLDTQARISDRSEALPLQAPQEFSTSAVIPRTEVNAGHPFDRDRPLPRAEETKFFGEIREAFGAQAIRSLRTDQLNQALAKLNERRSSGVRSILDHLSSVAHNNQEVEERLYLVDYLKYRSRWDEKTADQVKNLILAKLDLSVPAPYLAAQLVDRAELLNGLARWNWDLAAQTLRSIEHPKLKELASFEAWMGLIESGMPRSIALQEVQKINPAYKG